MAYDTLRKLSILIFITTIIGTIYYWILKMEEEMYFTMYIGGSLTLLFLTLSFHRNRTRENAVLFSIVRHSKYAKKMIAKDRSVKTYGMDESLDAEGNIIFFTENASSKKPSSSQGLMFNTASALTAASVFMDLPFSDAVEICCKKFKLDGDNKLKIISKAGIEYVRIIDGWYTPGPYRQSIYKNNTELCIYDDLCKDTLYSSIINFIWYVSMILLLLVIIKTASFIVRLFKTPIRTETKEYTNSIVIGIDHEYDTNDEGFGASDKLLLPTMNKNKKSNERMLIASMAKEDRNKKSIGNNMELRSIKITKNIYVSKFRLAIVIAYLGLLMLVYNYADSKFNFVAMADSDHDSELDTYSYYINDKQVNNIDVLALLIKTSAIDTRYIKNIMKKINNNTSDIEKTRSKRDVDNIGVHDPVEEEKDRKDLDDFEVGIPDLIKALSLGERDVEKLNKTLVGNNPNSISINTIEYLNETEGEGRLEGFVDIDNDNKKATLSGSPKVISMVLTKDKPEFKEFKVDMKVRKPREGDAMEGFAGKKEGYVKEEIKGDKTKIPSNPDEGSRGTDNMNTLLDELETGTETIGNNALESILNSIYDDGVLLDEDAIVDLTCIYDEVLYLTTGNLKSRCIIDNNIKGKILLPENNTDYDVTAIDEICRSVYNINLARLGFPTCFLDCAEGKNKCKVVYRPNVDNDVPEVRLNDVACEASRSVPNPTYEEFKIYIDTDEKKRVKKSVVDAKGNIIEFDARKNSEYMKKIKMTIKELDKTIQEQEDYAFEHNQGVSHGLNLGYQIKVPASKINGETLAIKRKTAKDKIFAENWLRDTNQNTKPATQAKSQQSTAKQEKIKVNDIKNNNGEEKPKVLTVNMKSRIVGFGEGTYVTDNYFTQFDDIFSGSVLIAENAELDTSCATQYSDRYKYAACSKGRRQVISCEPDLWGAFTFGNTFKCRTPDKFEGGKMPNWRKSNPKIDYTIPDKKESRDLKMNEQQTTFKMGDITVSGTAEILWGRSYQDNIQQIGSLKYFVYSFVVKLVVKSISDSSYGFVRLWDMEINKVNRWKSRTFDEHYTLYKDGPMATSNMTRLIPESIIEILYLEEPGIGDDMLQDRSRLNMVLKADIFDSNMVKMTRTSQPCLPSPTKPCEYIIPIYYAIRLYGPAKLKVKVFEISIEEIAFSKDVCSSVNAISVNNICYMFDETQSSTEVMVGGYPWTEMSAIILDRWTSPMEIPSFYLNHPKVGSGQYLSKVSTTANIGFFSIKGKCDNTYYEESILKCDGYNAASLDMVEYSTFHRPLTSLPSCSIKKQNNKNNKKIIQCITQDTTRFTVCNHNVARKYKFNKECKTIITKKLIMDMDDQIGISIKTPMVAYQFQQGKSINYGKIHYIIECWHRSTIAVSILILLSGIGYVLFILHLICILLGYINSYNIGVLLRKLNMAWLFGKRNTIRCLICKQMIFNQIEKNKHTLCCKRLLCPYCITTNIDDNLCALSFKNRNSYREHAKIHHNIRVNPYSGYINVRRNRVVAFGLTPLQMICMFVILLPLALCSNIPQDESGLRSNRIGNVIDIDSKNLKCDNTRCTMLSSVIATLPLVDGSGVVLKSKDGDREYAKKYTIKNPHLKTSCSYEYSSPHIKLGGKRLVYCCKGKTECNSGNQNMMLQSPVGGMPNKPEYIPLDPSNPLKSLDCPKAVTCRSPIVNFFWLGAGCYSVNDGTAVGYEFYLPDIKKPMVNVFKCKVVEMSYTVCSDTTCVDINGLEEDIERGKIKFEHIKQHLPVEFTVGAVSTVGEIKPDHVFYDLPNVGSNTANTLLAYKLNKIPQGDVCLSGSEYNDGSCDINTSGATPNMNCKSTIPEPTIEQISKQYESVNDVFHCNFEETSLSWTTGKVRRKIRIADQDFEDEQTYSWPSITLSTKNCMFGMTDIDLMAMGNLDLDIVKYSGKITRVQCSGFYNRNQKTVLTFTLDKSDGVIDFKCPNSFTDTCVFNTATTSSCNVTTLLPFKHNCVYGGDQIEVDCSGLEFSEADPTSGHTIGWTGSDSIMTWPSSIKIMFTNWWGIGLLIVSIIFGVILLLWIIHVSITIVHAHKVASATGSKLAAHNAGYEHIVLDDDVYNQIIKRDMDDEYAGKYMRQRGRDRSNMNTDNSAMNYRRGNMLD
uniref:Putative glycoprotein n=1 Tax=Hubei bunya-like virus 10 TaxID=1922843 RepID=A0A1L3KPG6_9VIRU|nr:putative glycoprotein [Hubei bunya-like virus 10]